MGMAASQARLLQLTSRKNTIGRQLEHLSLEKTSLTREMREVSRNYQNALNTKTLKWSNNGGVNYVDLSYNNLMRPSVANGNVPYLLTDSSGRVVLDNKYQKYAEMISPDGTPNLAGWEENKHTILAELTGMEVEDVATATTAKANAEKALERANKLKEEMDILKGKSTKDYTAVDFMLNCFGNITGFDYNNERSENGVGCDYRDNANGAYRLDPDKGVAKTRLQDMLNQITNNVSQFLSTKDAEIFKSACNTVFSQYSGLIDNAEADCFDKPEKSISIEATNNSSNICIRVGHLMDSILAAYETAGGSVRNSARDGSDTKYYTCFKSQADYQAYAAKEAEYEAAVQEYESCVNVENQIWDADQETNIAFYEQLFTAIAEKGWVANSEIDNPDYLNEMLLNNEYYITTMKEEENEEGEDYFSYDTDLATNFNKIYIVNDSEAANEALAVYEYEKSIINEKESRIDTRMQNLETEQSAINNMIKGIEKVRDENEERTFGIMA